MKFSMTGYKKRWPFNTGDCLIEVTAWAGLTVHVKSFCIKVLSFTHGYCCNQLTDNFKDRVPK
jgi:hypothetical protein